MVTGQAGPLILVGLKAMFLVNSWDKFLPSSFYGFLPFFCARLCWVNKFLGDFIWSGCVVM